MTNKKHIAGIAATLMLLWGCAGKPLYLEYQTIPASGWHADSTLTFTTAITDTTSAYDVLLYLRHTDRYQYQNIWLFIDNSVSETADSIRENTLLGRDTIEFYLADERGRWLGNGYGNIREMPVLYMQNVRYKHAGNYSYTVSQGMRDEMLKGVSDIGIKIVRHNE